MESNIKDTDEQTLKKGRHRKKQLYHLILQQMEFYFSDSNLTKDRFLSQLLQQSQDIDLNVFLKFNKLRKLTSNIEDIQKAIKNSTLIQLSEDKTAVRRKEPIKEKPNVEQCTIYVERLKSDATHEWLSSVFSEFGNVVYISIPKYKNNNVIKGFAFIEFEKEDEAEKALNYFESIGCKMPSYIEPEKLCSIATFEGPKDQEIHKTSEETSNKRKFEEIDESKDDGEGNKKLKTETEETLETDDLESKKKKKLKKEHKKKNYIKELGLQVLSKTEWKRMRNRYLDLQKKKMKEFKKHLNRAKYSQNSYEDKQKKTSENTQQNKSCDMVDGVIVKVKMTEPIADIKKLKNELKSASSDIMYVDVSNAGNDEIFLRFNQKNNATKYCNEDSSGKRIVLSGQDEKDYWDRIKSAREQKLKKNKTKQRGRDKLLKKAKHTKFDE